MEVEENANSKQQLRGEETLEDLTQRLPDHIITYILGILPCTRKSIQTSVLSKRWESFWASAPVLTFNQHLDQTFPIHSDEFCSRVDKTLIQCSSHVNLEAFNLDFYFKAKYKPQVNRWLRHATRRNVKDISLNFLGGESYRLPLFLCRCSTLTDLDIKGCKFPSLPIPFSWSSMKFLSLDSGSYNGSSKMYEEMFEAIQFSCPLLEKWVVRMDFRKGVYRVNSLTLKTLSLGDKGRPPSSSVIEIWAPNLNIFTLYRMDNWKAINFNEVSSLLEVFITTSDGLNSMSPKFMNQALRKLHGVEKFTFALFPKNQIFSKLQATKMTPIVLENCKDLSLSNITLPGLLFLLNVSPNLKKLTLYLDSDKDEGEWETPKSTFACLNSHLTTITIHVLCYTTYRLRSKYFCGLLKFFLAKAMVLEKLRIITNNRCEYEEVVSRLILSYEKASRNAVVKFEWGQMT